MGFDLFDPRQWADVGGYALLAIVALLTLVGVVVALASSGRWDDWLDEVHGRGSLDDPWERR